jgi:hypothetical protein
MHLQRQELLMSSDTSPGAGATVHGFLTTFEEFPQRQKVGSFFSLDQVLETLQDAAKGSNCRG